VAKLTVSKIKHVLTADADIDIAQRFDGNVLDEYVNTCITAAQNALQSATPTGFSDLGRDTLQRVIEGIRSAHESIRRLLKDEPSASSVDAMTVARLQLEALYSFCFLLQDPNNVAIFLKSGWKKQYIRLLLMREESINIQRFSGSVNSDLLPTLERMGKIIGVTDAEKRTIENDELGTQMPAGVQRAFIEGFPTPGKVIDRIVDIDQKGMLERLYPEYQWLCSFAHGDQNASFFRTALDKRSPPGKRATPEAREAIFQKLIAEESVFYSSICAVQAATEVAAKYPGDIELMVKVTTAWTGLNKFTLLA